MEEPYIFNVLVGFMLGLFLGSFSSALIWRIPQNIPWAYAPRTKDTRGGFVRSQCTTCHHILGHYDLIPIVSYVLNRGACRYCRAPISIRYVILESVAGVCGALIMAISGVHALSLLCLLAGIFLYVLLYIGYTARILAADILFVFLILCGCAFSVWAFTNF